MLLGSAVTKAVLQTDPRYQKGEITLDMLSNYALEQRAATDSDVMKVLNGVKDEYGSGASTLIRIFNASGERLFLREDFHLRGNTWKYPFDMIIENGQWLVALVVKNGTMEGVAGGVVYHSATADMFFGWDVPYVDATLRGHKNTVYSEIRHLKNWDRKPAREEAHRATNKAAASWHAPRPDSNEPKDLGYRVSIFTAAGSSPITDVTIGRTETLK